MCLKKRPETSPKNVWRAPKDLKKTEKKDSDCNVCLVPDQTPLTHNPENCSFNVVALCFSEFRSEKNI